MEVGGRALIFLLIFTIASSSSQKYDKEIDDLVIHEKIDRVGNVQDGGAEDLEILITKDVMENFDKDKDFFASNH